MSSALLPRRDLPLLLRRLPRALRHAVPRSRRLGLRMAEPVLPVLRRAAHDPLEDVLPALWRFRLAAFGPDLQLAQPREHRLHRLLRIEEELAAPHPHEAPAEPLEDGLSRHVLTKLIDRDGLVAVALDGEAASSALDDQVDRVVADPPVGQHAVARLEQPVVDLVLERRFRGALRLLY